MRATLARLDAGLYRGEKAVVWVMFLAMVAVMFVNVTQRVFSRPEGRLSGLVLEAIQGMGFSPDPATIHGPVAVIVNIAVTFLVCFLAARSAERPSQPVAGGAPGPRLKRYSTGGAAVVGAGLTVALTLGVWLTLVLFPNGLIEAIKYAGICVLWIGLLGASLAAYEKRHLALEIADRVWPAKLAPAVKATSMVAAAVFVLFLLVLSVISVVEHRASHEVNAMTGVVIGTSIPLWVVYLIFPYALGVMTFRFLGQAVRG